MNENGIVHLTPEERAQYVVGIEDIRKALGVGQLKAKEMLKDGTLKPIRLPGHGLIPYALAVKKADIAAILYPPPAQTSTTVVVVTDTLIQGLALLEERLVQTNNLLIQVIQTTKENSQAINRNTLAEEHLHKDLTNHET